MSTQRRGDTLAVFAAYLLLAILLTWPLLERLGSAVPSDPGDPLLNTWILWWNARTIPFSGRWWNAPAFFPAEGVTAFSEPLLGLSLISTPIYWVSGNAQLAYNSAFLLTFPLSSLAQYALARELTGRRDAAFISGLVFGFAPYRMAHLPHIQVLASFWMPLALLGLHRFLRDGRVKWLALFGGAWLLQSVSNLYYAIFFSILVLIWIAWFLPGRRVRDAAWIAAAWALAAVPLLPLLLRYRSTHAWFGFGRRFSAQDPGADLASLLDASPLLAVWGSLRAYHRPEGELFPGIAGILLVTVGIAVSLRLGTPRSPRLRRVRLALLGTLLACAAIGISAIVAPWRVSIAGITISLRHADRPLFLAGVALIGLLLTNPNVTLALRRRSAFVFYVVAAAMMWVFCLGPVVTAWGARVIEPAPYAWLLAIPGFDSLRVPARFAMVAILCLSCASALAFTRVAPLDRTKQLVLTGFVAVIALSDGWLREMPLVRAPPKWSSGGLDDRGAVIELPFGDDRHDLAAMYRGIHHGHPVVNGYSGYFAPTRRALQNWIATGDHKALEQLASLGVTCVAVDTNADSRGQSNHYVASHRGAHRVRVDGAFVLYRLRPESGSLPSPVTGASVPIAALQANVNPDLLSALTDGDLTTRWHTGPQRATHELTLDLGETRTVTAVVLSLGPYSEDFPRELAIDVSQDGHTWIPAWQGKGAGPTYLAAIRQPSALRLTLDLGRRPARFLRLRQLGEDRVYYWSVAELTVAAET